MIEYVMFLGAAIGFGGGYYCWKAKYDLLKATHELELKEQTDEVKRLRAQVARLVGSEPQLVHSAGTITDRQIARAA